MTMNSLKRICSVLNVHNAHVLTENTINYCQSSFCSCHSSRKSYNEIVERKYNAAHMLGGIVSYQ